MNEYPPQNNQPPQEPQQEIPSQSGEPLYPQYPNYQPQPGQYPLNQPQQQSRPLPEPQPQIPVPGAGQPKKKHGPWFWILITLGILIVFSMCIGISQAVIESGPTSNTSASATDTLAPTDTPTAAPTPTDTPTPVPTLSPAQIEKVYKAITTSTTVDNLDKDGNNDKGQDVHFTCKILGFVKDNSGNTAGANVQAPDSSSTSVIQIIFPSGTDITKLNEGDILEVWGTDEGVFSGQNAFGGTVQEVGIGAQYMTDTTTNYQTS